MIVKNMHAKKSIIFANDQQAKAVYNHKNIKEKLCKAKAAIWFDFHVGLHSFLTKHTPVCYGSMEEKTIPLQLNTNYILSQMYKQNISVLIIKSTRCTNF